MARFPWGRARIAGAAGAVALAGGVLVAGVASAQTPTPAPSAAPIQTQPGQNRPDASQLAARLAQALGISQDRVEQAFQQQRAQHQAEHLQQLAPAAQQLGVTAQQLADAMTAARQSLRGSATPGQRPDRTQGQQPDRTPFYAAIAQQLGGGRTAAQVQAALESLRASGQQTRPTQEQIQQRVDQHLQSLAQALGVTVDQLRAAFQQIGAGPFGGGGFPRRGR